MQGLLLVNLPLLSTIPVKGQEDQVEGSGIADAHCLPVVTRFFWPPLMPLIIALPTGVSAHTCSYRCKCWTHSKPLQDAEAPYVTPDHEDLSFLFLECNRQQPCLQQTGLHLVADKMLLIAETHPCSPTRSSHETAKYYRSGGKRLMIVHKT